MALYAISDLHLPLGVNKPMDIFGKKWDHYVARIEENWKNTVTDADTVLIPGDISWATYPEEAVADLKFINGLPGTKILSRGNHDYWWPTMNKLSELKEREGLSTLRFLHNTTCRAGDVYIAACRGWITPDEKKFTAEDDKIYKREQIRLELSLSEAKNAGAERIVAAIHFPPLGAFAEILSRYGVEEVVYGHLHHEIMGSYNEISPRTHLVSCDYLSFFPEKIIM